MGPVGHVPSNCGDHGGQDPLQLLQLAAIFRWAMWEADSASPDLLFKWKGVRKET